MDSTNWIYGEIHINEMQMGMYSTELNSAIILHEMLHVYGLKDQYYDPNCIMYGYTPKVYHLTPTANDVLNSKYSY